MRAGLRSNRALLIVASALVTVVAVIGLANSFGESSPSETPVRSASGQVDSAPVGAPGPDGASTDDARGERAQAQDDKSIEATTEPTPSSSVSAPAINLDEMHKRGVEAHNRMSFVAVTEAREKTRADALAWWTARPLWGDGSDKTEVTKTVWFASTTDGVLDDPSAGRGNLYEFHVGNSSPNESSLADLLAAGSSGVNSQLWDQPPEYPYLDSRPALVAGRNARIAKMTMKKHGIDAWDIWWSDVGAGPDGSTITTHVIVGTAHYSEDEAITFAESLKPL